MLFGQMLLLILYLIGYIIIIVDKNIVYIIRYNI